uniref:TAFII55 protein conserved region domain-containing protein n=1 Tax=Chenopodium quinoa TaxID=63459 RepID=A0A803MN94_CHEQI
MTSLQSSSTLPCIMFGDFNEITSLSEKEGGVQRSERLMDAFREAIDQCHLRDLGFKGSTFIWERGNSMSTFVREWLDRFLADDRWMTLFPEYEVRNFPIYSSDHAPIMVYLKKKAESDRCGKSFKFEPLWLSREDCGEIVDRSWNASLELNIDRKIARCGEDLISWAMKSFGSIKKKIKDTEKRLRVLKEGAMDGATLELCKQLAEQLDSLYMQEESFWMEEQFILRVPPSIAERIEQLLNEDPSSSEDKSLDLSFTEDGRSGTFMIGDERFPASLLDLPCVTESYKTYDDSVLIKTADIGQMILVREGNDNPPDTVEYRHGLTPPMRDARRRRFRREPDLNDEDADENVRNASKKPAPTPQTKPDTPDPANNAGEAEGSDSDESDESS